jgi:hypothetical protein
MDQADEDVLEARLVRVEILEGDSSIPHRREKGRHAGPVGLGVEFVGKLRTVLAQFEFPVGQFRGNGS